MGAVSSRNEITVQKWPVSDRAPVEATESFGDEEDDGNNDIGIQRPFTPGIQKEQSEANKHSLPSFSDEESPLEGEIKLQVPQIRSNGTKEENDQDESVKYTNDMDEIQKLEQTFDSLGIPSPSSPLVEESNLIKVNSEEDQVRQRWQDIARLGLGTPDLKKMSYGSFNDATARISRSAAGRQTYLIVPTNTFASIENNGNSKSAPITLIQHKNGSSSSVSGLEEWTYQKSSVDGFDPEKFRKINRKEESPELQSPQNISYSSALEKMSSHHKDVPNYDPMEQQILESIENEFIS